MFLELMNDLLINSPMFYVYFGIVLSTIGAIQLIRMSQYVFNSGYEVTLHRHKTININIELIDKPIIPDEPKIIWFIKSFKRINKPDDDKEDSQFSYFTNAFKIRGGFLWRETSYSRSLKNIALLA